MCGFTFVLERCADTNLLVGYVPGFPGACNQAETTKELRDNMRNAISMLLEDGEAHRESEFAGMQTVRLGM